MIVYDASKTSISWLSVLFVLPHLILGFTALAASYKRRCWLKNFSRDSPEGILLQAFLGLLFLLAGSYYYINGFYNTYNCSKAAYDDQIPEINGTVESVEMLGNNPMNFEYRFKIKDKFIVSKTQGSECGFIRTFGAIYKLKMGQNVVIKLYKNNVVYVQIN